MVIRFGVYCFLPSNCFVKITVTPTLGASMIERTLFNSDHESFRDSFRKFIEKEISPFHAEWEEQGYVARDVWNKAGENGFLCMSMPEQYGGAGAGKRFFGIQLE